MIPHINKTVDVVLSEHIEAHNVNVREVIDEFRGQVDDYTAVFEAVVLMAPGRFRVTFRSSRKMEAAEHSGLVVRGYPVEFVPVSQYKWVNVTRLSYGIPDEEIRKVLEVYGPIRLIKSEIYSRIYTVVRHVLMEVRENIPFRIRIAGHWCFVHYRGQKRVCFQCGKERHQRDQCLSDAAHNPSADVQSRDTTTAPAARTETVDAPQSEVVDAPRSEVVDVPLSEGVDGPQSEVVRTSRSEVVEVPRAEIVDLSRTESASVLALLLDRVGEGALSRSVAATPPAAGVVTPPANVAIPVDPISDKPSRAGGKCQCSHSRSKSSSPVNKDRRRDASLDPDDSQAVIDLPEMSGALANTTMPVISPELLPLPADDDMGDFSDTSLGFSSGDVTALEELLEVCTAQTNLDTPLTQVTPNLPCDTQERVQRSPVPENSQLSDETLTIARFFATTSSSPEEDVD